jgi:Domain of unknown function (DUF5665)
MDQINTNEEILLELKKLNKKLEKFTHPLKAALLNFSAGTFRSLGTIFGTLIIASALIYVFSQVNFTKAISTWIENTLSQVNFEKIIAPQIKTIEQKSIDSN